MDISQHIVFLIEIIGTIAFASSGTMVAIEKKLDLFGVIILGLSTAVGGGMIRDLILGIHPPMMFQNSIYVKISVIVSVIIFLIVYWNNQILNSKYMKRYTFVMNLFDAIGLGAFTVIGIHTAYDVGLYDRTLLLTTVGMMTGVGGGMVRDVLAGQTPTVLKKHIYASASFVGAIVCIIMIRSNIDYSISMIIGALLIIIIRFFATKYRWNLPKAVK